MVDEELFEEFVRNRAATLYRYGYLLAGNHHDADDLVQDALIKLQSHWGRVVRKDDPTGYVRRTMTRLHVSVWRRRRRELPSSAVSDTATIDPSLGRVEEHDHLRRVCDWMRTLPPRQRAVLFLRYYEDLSDEEIATTLGVTRGTVRSQASRALEKLRMTGVTETVDEFR